MSDSQEPPLRPANENPWYCLATLHGEQPRDRLDKELAEKNHRAWQQWVGGILNSTGRAEFLNAFIGRMGRPSHPPEPTEEIDFSDTSFDRRVIFHGFSFRERAHFRSAVFSEEADFSGAQFSGQSIDFSSAKFLGVANFSHAQFSVIGGSDFQSATFSDRVDFQYANFVDPNFHSVKFADAAHFNHTRFTGRADFLSTIFSDVAHFDSAVFNNEADFESATFAEATYFRSATFSSLADFSKTTFSSHIYFVNAKFDGNTVFAHSCFAEHVPDFRGATLHQATEWHGIVWPKPPKNKDDAQQQVYAYERLKQEMEQLKKHDDEQRFFRRELRARRGLVSPLSGKWLLNFAYDASSFYGNSVSRPLYWLLVVFAAGAAIFARAPIHCGAPMPLRLAIKLSFANMFVFLPDKREIMTPEMISCLSDTTRALSAIQSVSGVVLLFLLGLALRNRFRMK